MTTPVFGGHLNIRAGKILIFLFAFIAIVLNATATSQKSNRGAAQSMILNNHELAFVALNLRLVTQMELSSTDLQALSELVQRYQSEYAEGSMKTGYVYFSRRPIKVQTFEDYLEKNYRVQFWNETALGDLSVAELLKLARPVFYSSDIPKVQRQIDQHIKARTELVHDRLLKLVERSINVTDKMIDQIKEQGVDAKPVPQRTAAYLRTVLEERLNESFASDELIVLKKLLMSYFKNLPKDRLAEIAFEISKLPMKSTPLDVASVAILNSGPHLQKLLQLLARNPHLPAKLREIFEKLESGSKAVPWKKVAKALDAEKIRQTEFIYFEKKPLGVGSMAQTHRVQYLTQDQKRKSAVVRLLKPGIFRLVEIDERVLTAVALDLDRDADLKRINMPDLSPLIDDISKSIAEELNVALTIRNQNEGGRVYSKELLIAFNQQKNYLVVGAPSTFAPIGSTSVMIQDLVIGNKPAKEFEELKSLYPSLYRKVSEKLTEIWIEEAFFGSGFFHADLHQGNIMVLYTDQEISLQILDYGMVGRLNSSLQKSILLFTVAVQTGNAKLITTTLSNLSKASLSDAKMKSLLNKVIQRLHSLGRMDQSDLTNNTIEGWTAWALSEGIEFNYEFLKLNRALQAIKSLLLDSGSPLSVQDIAKDVTLKYKGRFSKMVLSEPHLGAKDYALLLKEAFPQRVDLLDITPVRAHDAVRCEALF